MQSEALSKKMGDIILDPQSVKVDAIKHKKVKHSQTPNRARNQSENSDDESLKSKIKCSKCGMKHAKRKCPAFGKECFQCGKKNHFGKFCKSQTTSKKNKDVDDITEYQYNTEGNYYCFED